jgi:hypothetical protein
MDGSMKLFKPPFVIEATARLGYSESTIVGIGVTLAVCTVLYLISRTAVLGAILLTGYLGGAVASNVRAGTSIRCRGCYRRQIRVRLSYHGN